MPRTKGPARLVKKSRRTNPPKKDKPMKSKRTKGKKSKRTVMPKPRGRMIHNCGGHMINPPEDCPHRKKFSDDGGIWVDFAVCSAQYCDQYPCGRRIWFNKASAEERNAEWKRCGVIYFIPFQNYHR